jgi:hypothetical protein
MLRRPKHSKTETVALKEEEEIQYTFSCAIYHVVVTRLTAGVIHTPLMNK